MPVAPPLPTRGPASLMKKLKRREDDENLGPVFTWGKLLWFACILLSTMMIMGCLVSSQWLVFTPDADVIVNIYPAWVATGPIYYVGYKAPDSTALEFLTYEFDEYGQDRGEAWGLAIMFVIALCCVLNFVSTLVALAGVFLRYRDWLWRAMFVPAAFASVLQVVSVFFFPFTFGSQAISDYCIADGEVQTQYYQLCDRVVVGWGFYLYIAFVIFHLLILLIFSQIIHAPN